MLDLSHCSILLLSLTRDVLADHMVELLLDLLEQMVQSSLVAFECISLGGSLPWSRAQ